MTIKYECDICGQVVNTAEAVGPKVVVDDTYGKNYDYEDAKTGMALSIRVTSIVGSVEDGTDNEGHFCFACMWKTVKRMVAERAPKDELVDDLSNFNPVGYSGGIFGRFQGTDYRYFDGVLYKRVVPDENSSGSPSEHTELSELYAEGQLPETGPDEPADDPGPWNRDAPRVDNFDPGPTPEAAWAKEQRPNPARPVRRGWRHPGRI